MRPSLLLLLVLAACGHPPGELGTSGVWLTYSLGGTPFVHDVEDGTTADLTTLLDAVEPRGGTRHPESQVNVAPDSSALAVMTERFHADCAGWPCVAVVSSDATTAEVVEPPSGVVHAADLAVGPDGDLVVYSDDDRVLWATTRSSGWSEPIELTASSSYAYGWRPAVSADGSTVLFDCGDELFPAEAICEVGTDGTGFRVVATNDGGPDGTSGPGVHHADYGPGGSIVFEAEYAGGEQIWRTTGGPPELVQSDAFDDNSPCVLADGRIASLWLDRPDGDGSHELKLLDADGSGFELIVEGEDVDDIGLGCGG